MAIGEALYDATAIDGTLPEKEVSKEIWKVVSPLLEAYHENSQKDADSVA